MKASILKEIIKTWFRDKVTEKLNLINKFFKKFKKSRLHTNKELNKKSKYDALKQVV